MGPVVHGSSFQSSTTRSASSARTAWAIPGMSRGATQPCAAPVPAGRERDMERRREGLVHVVDEPTEHGAEACARSRGCRRLGCGFAVRIAVVAPRTPTTVGNPNLRPAIAVCERREPRSTTRPREASMRYSQPGSVSRATRIRPSSSGPSGTSEELRAASARGRGPRPRSSRGRRAKRHRREQGGASVSSVRPPERPRPRRAGRSASTCAAAPLRAPQRDERGQRRAPGRCPSAAACTSYDVRSNTSSSRSSAPSRTRRAPTSRYQTRHVA